MLGERKGTISEDDYVVAALLVYLDTVTIFVYLVKKLVNAIRNVE